VASSSTCVFAVDSPIFEESDQVSIYGLRLRPTTEGTSERRNLDVADERQHRE
jgi:hypothetical protein